MSNPRDFHAPQSSYTKEDLLRSSEGGYFGPGNAQLPAPPMLMIDRITEISLDGGEFGKGHVIAELDIAPRLWFFDCHFLGDPVMPGDVWVCDPWLVAGFRRCRARASPSRAAPWRGEGFRARRSARRCASPTAHATGQADGEFAARVRDLFRHRHRAAAWEAGRTNSAMRRTAVRPPRPSQPSAVKKQASTRSGTNPDDRNRNRNTQTKCAENRRNEFRKQTCFVFYAR